MVLRFLPSIEDFQTTKLVAIPFFSTKKKKKENNNNNKILKTKIINSHHTIDKPAQRPQTTPAEAQRANSSRIMYS